MKLLEKLILPRIFVNGKNLDDEEYIEIFTRHLDNMYLLSGLQNQNTGKVLIDSISTYVTKSYKRTNIVLPIIKNRNIKVFEFAENSIDAKDKEQYTFCMVNTSTAEHQYAYHFVGGAVKNSSYNFRLKFFLDKNTVCYNCHKDGIYFVNKNYNSQFSDIIKNGTFIDFESNLHHPLGKDYNAHINISPCKELIFAKHGSDCDLMLVEFEETNAKYKKQPGEE